ncbi:COMPASS component SWD2 [Candida viswanathii]|uniref:COMPASS component SWD2 n=1 Tax=Candida viswanathii TaxID=5486 RepID=A0A367XR17_9ASCO|nr:COMPASS component SWD2 [Candida viswanathii]
MSRTTTTTGNTTPGIHLDARVLSTLHATKSFNYHQGASITSLDFDDAGQYLISSGIDKSIQLYDCHKGTHVKDIQSQKYGAHSARFTHEELNCLYVSTPEGGSSTAETTSGGENDTIRYLSLNNNQYIRYFKGHKAQVSSVEVNPVENTFMSASYDGSVKVWDLKSSSAVGNVEVGYNSVIGYDPQGVVFGIGKCGTNKDGKEVGVVKLYDLKSFDKAPFLVKEVPVLKGQMWNKLEFSNNGKLILIATDSPEHYVLDAFLGDILAIVRLAISSSPEKTMPWMQFKYPYTGCCTFSPCGRYLFVGSPKCTINIYDVSGLQANKEKGRPVILSRTTNVLQTSSCGGVPKIVAFNPRLFELASADTTVTLWLPTEK